MRERPDESSRARTRGIFLALFSLAVAIRCTNFKGVFTPTGVFPQATDSYYHLRRIQSTVNHFPRVPDNDFYLNFPAGGATNWPFGFDTLYAAFAKTVTPGGSDAETVAAACSILTPLLGAIVPCLGFMIGRTLGSVRIGILAGLLLALLPAVTLSAGVGVIDHHVCEPLWFAAFLAAYLAALRRVETGWDRRAAWTAAAAGAAVTGGLLCTTVLPLLVPLLAGFLVVQIGWAWRQPALRHRLAAMNVMAWMGMLATLAPFVATRLAEPGGVNPALGLCWLVGATVCLTTLAPSAMWRGDDRPADVRRWAAVFLGVLGVIVLARFDFRGALEFVRYGISYFYVTDPLIAGIQESQPLWRHSARYILWLYSGCLVVWPFALAWALWEGRRRSLGLWCVALAAVPATALALVQLRFSDFFGVPFAVVTAAALAAVWTKWEAGAATGRARFIRQALAGAAVALALWPTLREISYQRPFVVLDGDFFVNLKPTLDWIAGHTPPTSPDARQSSDYSIATDWNVGHWVVYFGNRPTFAAPLGHMLTHRVGIRDGAASFMRPPEEAWRVLERRRARYILVTPLPLDLTYVLAGWDPESGKMETTGDRDAALRDSMYARLLGFDAGQFPDNARNVLRRVRLVHEEDRLIPYPRFQRPRPAALLFEMVPGAVLCGTTRPEAAVTVSGRVKTGTGREFVYRDEARADASGRFTLVVPYATGKQEFSDAVLVDGYVVAAAGASGRASPLESEVRSGASVAVVWNGPSGK